jgi:hypothetical protein
MFRRYRNYDNFKFILIYYNVLNIIEIPEKSRIFNWKPQHFQQMFD